MRSPHAYLHMRSTQIQAVVFLAPLELSELESLFHCSLSQCFVHEASSHSTVQPLSETMIFDIVDGAVDAFCAFCAHLGQHMVQARLDNECARSLLPAQGRMGE
jgi:hypothetical protein